MDYSDGILLYESCNNKNMITSRVDYCERMCYYL